MMNTSQSDVIGTTRANPGETLRQARENKAGVPLRSPVS